MAESKGQFPDFKSASNYPEKPNPYDQALAHQLGVSVNDEQFKNFNGCLQQLRDAQAGLAECSEGAGNLQELNQRRDRGHMMLDALLFMLQNPATEGRTYLKNRLNEALLANGLAVVERSRPQERTGQ